MDECPNCGGEIETQRLMGGWVIVREYRWCTERQLCGWSKTTDFPEGEPA